MVNRKPKGLVGKKDATIKAGIDEDLQVTAWGGLALVEHLARQIGLWKKAEQLLPQRVQTYGYTSVNVAASVVYGLLQGGQGFQAAQALSEDTAAQRLLGLHHGVPEEATVYRAMCDLAGLAYRDGEATYVAEEGRARKRRVVGEVEEAQALLLALLADWLRWQAAKLLPGLPRAATHLGPYLTVFGDATQLEVDGRCFDAAEVDYNGNRSLQWGTLWVGPLLAAQVLRGGARHEAQGLLPLLEPAQQEVLRQNHIEPQHVLALLDSAYGEEPVLAELERLGWRYLVGLSTNPVLERTAREQPPEQWVNTGPRPANGWAESAACAMRYGAEGWDHSRTVIARRFRREGELFTEYRFVVTDLGPAEVWPALPESGLRYAEALWRMYGHKQAREVQYQTPLSDLGLHHPPSGRLGCNQVFYQLAGVALNLGVALALVGMEKKERGLRLWRLRTLYLAVAARVQRHAGQVFVQASGALEALRKKAWLNAFARVAHAW